MRVGIIGLLHESNTFISKPTTLTHFEQDTLLVGEPVREKFKGIPHEIGGFFQGLEREEIEAVPIFAARAIPYGPIETTAFKELIGMMRDAVERAGPLHGVLVAPHGATVCASIPDADGHWLNLLRQDLGDAFPIIGTLDAHANLSRAMVDATDALIAYRTNPHLDQRERGIEAARLIARTLRGEVNPVQRAGFPPLAINIERQLTTEPPLTNLYQLADELARAPGVLSNSILLGFPYADVHEMGSSVIVVTDGDPQLAGDHVAQLTDDMMQHRQAYDGSLTSIEDALKRTASLEGPVCLLDMGDNVGGGSPGDSTHIAQAILCETDWDLRGTGSKACMCIFDPASAAQATEAGVGATVRMQIGGKTDHFHGQPISQPFRVLGTYTGQFSETKIRHGGLSNYDQGLSAVVESTEPAGLTILLTSKRTPPFSLAQLTSCEMDPTEFRLLIAKGVNAPVAAYQEVCDHFIRVNSPGCTTADLRQLGYRNRRRPMFPFEDPGPDQRNPQG